MKLRDLSFIGLIVLVVAGLQTLSFVNKPPEMPGDTYHTAPGRNASDQCLRCHQSEAMTALEQAKKHPAKWRDAGSNCLRCHIPAGRANWKTDTGRNGRGMNGGQE